MTALEHVYAIKNILSHGSSSDDFRFSNRLILHFLEVARAMLIEQKANKYHHISELSFQSKCMDLELGSYHNCCDDTIGCSVLRTTQEIPKLLSTRFGNFLKVMTINGDIIPQAYLTENKYSMYSVSKPNRVTYSIHNNRIYLAGNTKLEKILVNGIFSSPQDAISECTGVDAECPAYFSQTFPIDSDLIAPCYEIVLKFLLEAPPADAENDAKDQAS